jgi:F420-dependent oxidoreductase-like protein
MARGELKLGLNLGYWGPPGQPPTEHEAVAEAERLGLDSIWTAESYGNDCFTPLGYWAAKTERVNLGTAIAQLSARPPAATAMAAMTLDHLSGGRAVLGLGVSGPQVVEGWYGDTFAKPLARTREYVQVLREIWRRDGPVVFEGEHYQLGLPGPSGLGKPLKLNVKPLREDLPIYLAAEGPKNVALAAEVCDGWKGLFFAPDAQDLYVPSLEEGFGRPGARRSWEDFEITTTVPFVVTDDVGAALDLVRPFYALYFGGMGAKDKNFHARVPIRMGYEAEVRRCQELYLEGKKDEAAAALPDELLDRLSLVGPVEKIRHDLEAWRESICTTILVQGDPQTVRTAAELVLG